MKNCSCGVCCFLGIVCAAIVLCCTYFVAKNCSIDINTALLVAIIILSVIVLAVIVAICIYFCSVASVKKEKIKNLKAIENFFYEKSSDSDENKKNQRKPANIKINNPLDENMLKLIRIYCDTLADI